MKKILLLGLLFCLTNLKAQICLHATQSYPVASSPWVVRNADLDGNSVPDLISISSVSSSSGAITSLMNYNPSTTNFSTTITTTLNPAANAVDIAVADFDGDGKQDVAVDNTGTPAVPFFPGNGAGVFNPPVNIGLTNNSQAITAADFNNDTK